MAALIKCNSVFYREDYRLLFFKLRCSQNVIVFFHNIIWSGALADIAFICELIGQECLGQGGYPGVWSTLALIVMQRWPSQPTTSHFNFLAPDKLSCYKPKKASRVRANA